MRTAIIAIIVAIAVPGLAGAPQAGTASESSPTLADLAWLVGSWEGQGLGGDIDEHWTAAAGGTMMGAFRLVAGGELRVIEYLMITQEEGRIVYRFKHFNGDYTTWEEDRPLEFTLIEVSEREAVFHSEVAGQHSPRRLTYRLEGADELQVVVSGSDEAGNLSESFAIRMTRH